jgi:hypothetical protein
MFVLVIRGAGPFRRDHQRAHGTLRRALAAEEFALRRLQDSLQHLTALRGLRICDSYSRDGELLLGIPVRVCVAQRQGRL